MGSIRPINPLSLYRECGYRCAKAVINKDACLARHEYDWYNRARRLERPELRVQAELAFKSGYAAAQPCRRAC